MIWGLEEGDKVLIDIYTIILLFFAGILVGYIDIILALKMPLKKREFVNSCDNCNHRYKWNELIPLVSYVMNRGKCPYCKKRKPIMYLILELLCGLMFSCSYVFYGFSYEMIAMILLTFMTISIYVSDSKYYVILDETLLLCCLMFLIFKFVFFGLKTFIISLCSGLLIFLFMLGVRFIGNKIFKQDSIGGGDIKLSMLFGFVLGVRLSIVSLILGSFLAFPCAVYYSLSKLNREIPFGPYLITGLYLVFVFMEPIRSFLTIIF